MKPALSAWIDESEKGQRLLAVGGVLCEWNQVPQIVTEWRRMKKEFGLSPDAEIKWNLASDHRKKLQEAGRDPNQLREAAVQIIRDQGLVCIVAVMFEERNKEQEKWAKASVRDFYCEGLKYVIQRVAEEVAEQGATSCVVVCDRPGLGKKPFQEGSIWRGAGAVQQAYAGWYGRRVGVGPGRQKHAGRLADINFHPSILIGDATYHDMLQIADVVVGLTRNWVDAVQSKKSDQWALQQIKTLKECFRRRHGNPDFFGDGLVVWPQQSKRKLWSALQRSLR